MRNSFLVATAALALVGVTPSSVRAQNVQQLLQGLTTGNQAQDQALRDAFERGYQKGRQDEAQIARRASRSEGSSRSDDYYNGRSGRSQAPNDPRGDYRR